MPRLLALFALLTVGFGLSPARVAAKASSLAALNVHVSDLPKGFQLVTDRRLTTAAAVATADSIPLTTLMKAGMVRANERMFMGGPTKARVTVEAYIYLLTSAAAAHGFYRMELQGVPGSVRRLPLGPIGDERTDLSGPGTVHGKSVTVNAAIFRRGAYVVAVGIAPATPSVTARQVGHLATIVDTRIQHAG